MTHDAEEQGNALAYQDMCKARQEFLTAWAEWVKTKPALAAQRDEAFGTHNTMRQLAHLHGE
jgi:hypothetical protein